MEYLDGHFDGYQIIPTDPDLARQARFYDRISDLYVINPTGAIFFESRKPEAEHNQGLIEQSYQTLHKALTGFEKHLEGRAYVLDNRFTMADIGLSCGLFYTQNMVDMDRYPEISRWLQGILSRASWQRIVKESEPFMALLA